MKRAIFLMWVAAASGHGQLNFPPNRNSEASPNTGGYCTKGECMWFSNNVEILGPPTIRPEDRTVQLDVNGGEADVFKTSPWRSPGTAPVFGSGCGVAGGSDLVFMNGGTAPKGIDQGFDGLEMPPTEQTIWERGTAVEVSWGIAANHAGGYQYRLCQISDGISEDCFQQTPLFFFGNLSWLVFEDGSRKAFPNHHVTHGVSPEGSEWMRNPIPGCYKCDAFNTCGAPIEPVPGFDYNTPWNQQVNCYGDCAGTGVRTADGSCGDFPPYFEPPAGATGFKGNAPTAEYPKGGAWDWSVADLVVVPDNIPTGDYLMSWRWDCEESTQVWQNCADIKIV